MEKGCAKKYSLRSIQCVKKGANFKGNIYGCVSDKKILQFLREGIKRIKRIGGNRNRGLGKISFECKNVEEQLIPYENTQKTFIGFDKLEDNCDSNYLILLFFKNILLALAILVIASFSAPAC